MSLRQVAYVAAVRTRKNGGNLMNTEDLVRMTMGLRLKPSEKLVLASLCAVAHRYTNADPIARFTIEHIAEDTDLGKITVQRALKSLEAGRLIRITKDRKPGAKWIHNRYIIRLGTMLWRLGVREVKMTYLPTPLQGGEDGGGEVVREESKRGGYYETHEDSGEVPF